MVKATMSPDCGRCRKPHLLKLGITRVVLLGVALSALAMLTWARVDIGSHLWPNLLDALRVGTLHMRDVDDFRPRKPVNWHERQGESLVRWGGAHSNHIINDSELVSSFMSTDDLAVDDGDCLGRSQQYKYRKRQYHFPLSKALAGALAKYIQMHSQCCARKQRKQAAAGARGGCQYVVYVEGYEGVGNRLLSLVTAFLYALVTNRALVIDASRGHLAQLLCEPFRANYQADRDREHYDDNRTGIKPDAPTTWLLPAQVAHGVRQQAVTLEAAMRVQFTNVTAVRMNLRHEQSAGDRQFFGAAAQHGLQKVPWVIWESNQYYVPRLFMLREFWASKLQAWFPDVSLVFTQLGRVLCVPRNAVWDTIQQVHEAEMAWGPRTVQVGIQVRRHSVRDNASFSEAVYRRISECVLGGGMVPPPTTTRRTETVAVLVTSLQSMYYEKMRERWNNVTGVGKGSGQVKFVMVSQEGTEQYSAEQARKALVEMWLLSLCNDALATSSWSTFGYVAHALAGMRPHILNIRGANPDGEAAALPACTRGQSPEPCLHYPFTTAMAAAARAASIGRSATEVRTAMAPAQQEQEQEHARWVERHVRACQDETRGLQLVA